MNQKIPQHVAIVMDGNGRWAENRGLPRSEGHRHGVGVVKNIVQACLTHKINVLSVWAFGSENWGRPIAEVNFLMDLFLQSLEKEQQELYENGIQLRFTGNREQLSIVLREQMQRAEDLTRNNKKLILNVVLNYGGKWDILQATKQLATNVAAKKLAVEDIDEKLFAQYLNTHDLPDPDLLIRTSGEQRISNFFLWQLAYSELYFSEVYWPDFTIKDFEQALQSYTLRERRYGKTVVVESDE